ncbi:T9SS type A sorting domain-containing protein [Chitinophaga nivalis]|uniref:T9SS type A sorting domain-containing protein n=1 Tax=Chitinophaga nivalis TaxID=2991709 RepID=A0ABT3IGY8_9BACT|nr:T9SS type A sorting domain-containing protein [Chitinophaga nivalis]MCW3467123.1 T9SS type A sorting domain-containing protein [Chitinophaga nivalis]MCW3483186.1 T9SS type A sorting domain-containing protein [Chitinophaga nivalis]
MTSKSMRTGTLLLPLFLCCFINARSQSWLTTGNAPGSSEFIGTTNAQDFRIRTNNIQRLTIANSSGFVGIGTTTPRAPLEVFGSIRLHAIGANTLQVSEVLLETVPALNAGGKYSIVNVNNNKKWEIIQGYNCGTVSDDLNFIYYPNTTTSCLDFSNPLTLAGDKVGINKTAAPTANFHVNGSVRFENLPSGAGTALVIDANGNIRRSSTPLSRESADATQQEILQLKEEINTLKQLINQLQTKVNSTAFKSSKAVLFPNYPNPYTNTTSIAYYLPEKVKNAKIMIYDNTGKIISTAVLTGRGQQQLTVQNSFTPGIYYYSLIVDGNKVDTKKMVLTKG